MLRELSLQQAYHKPEDDIAKDFYLPCLAASCRYDRAVGFFSSAVYSLAWPSLSSFVTNGGKIRLICSPVLSTEDSAALFEGYSARSESEQGALLIAEYRRLLNTPGTVKPARVLAALVALDVVDFRIAWVGSDAGAKSKRLFHDKLGIFRDAENNVVAFKGSMNETWAGLSLDGNLESVDVFLSWAGEREHQRVDEERTYFERLWEGVYPGVHIRPLPEIARDELVASADTDNWEALAEQICVEISAGGRWVPTDSGDSRVPRPHQLQALDAWEERGRRGILEHATGSGKTFTALCAMADGVAKGEVCVVFVPSDLLLQQWESEIRAVFANHDLRLLICGGGHTQWRDSGVLRQWTRAGMAGGPRIVLATVQTASTSPFLSLCSAGSHLFIIADEVHRLGSGQARRLLSIDSGPRLGLSATPERAGDGIGTAAILDYFHGVVPPPFTLDDAIAAGALTPYVYNICTVPLTESEQEQWDALTVEIRRLYSRLHRSESPDDRIDQRLKMHLIQRARIVKSAEGKVDAAANILKLHYKPGRRWIVYCDDQVQMRRILSEVRRHIHTGVYEYHSAMAGNREKTLRLFETVGGILVSIRCLDEGVDIPSVDSALILASSKNPREYIQRRGRVLRRFHGKSLAFIHDILVTPRMDSEESPETAIVEGEIVRAIEFGKSALNPSCVADLRRLAIDYDLDIERLRSVGFEDDSE